MRRYSLVLLVMVLVSCSSDSGSVPSPTQTSASTTVPTSVGIPDLQIDSVWVEPSGTPGFDHDLVMVVSNRGSGAANGFSAGCEWSCPGGTITGAGADAILGGFVAAYGSFTYKAPFLVQCAGPPGVLAMVCTVDYGNAVGEVLETNNQWQGTVSIP